LKGNILLTGATGFLGGYLIEEMVSRGLQPLAMVRKSSNKSDLEKLGVPIIEADLSDPVSLLDATDRVETVIHLAAYYTFHGTRDLYEKITVQGTRNLLDACLKNTVRRIIYCSTTEVLGPVEDPPGSEESPPNPQFEYGRSKLRAEALVRKYGAKGLEYTIIRPSGLYGPKNVDDVAFWFITSFARNSLPTRFIVGSGKSLIQFTHVRDAVRAFILALEKPEKSSGQTYIIADRKCYSYSEVYELLAEICSRHPPGMHVPPPLAKAMIAPVEIINRLMGKETFMWHLSTVNTVTQDRCYSVEKAATELGFTQEYELKAGLEETVAWYRAHGFL
jgi:nucleoside-diphosphate-sugar epimerase